MESMKKYFQRKYISIESSGKIFSMIRWEYDSMAASDTCVTRWKLQSMEFVEIHGIQGFPRNPRKTGKSTKIH